VDATRLKRLVKYYADGLRCLQTVWQMRQNSMRRLQARERQIDVEHRAAVEVVVPRHGTATWLKLRNRYTALLSLRRRELQRQQEQLTAILVRDTRRLVGAAQAHKLMTNLLIDAISTEHKRVEGMLQSELDARARLARISKEGLI